MDKKALEAAVIRCGWKGVWEDQLDGLFSKIQFLATKGRYAKLLCNVETANDQSNFRASILEVTFAFQFESAGMELEYETRQDPNHGSSIDFRWKTTPEKTVYIEGRLLQQDQATTKSIDDQLRIGNIWSVTKDGDGEHQDIVRVQQVILEKVQRKDGTPTKFLSHDQAVFNVVAVDISQIILGTFDSYDCLLVARGDPAVSPMWRRSIFGLFQEPLPQYPEQIQNVAKSFAHLKQTLHGVLFLFKRPKGATFNYSFEQLLVWNPGLMQEGISNTLDNKIESALPLYKKRER